MSSGVHATIYWKRPGSCLIAKRIPYVRVLTCLSNWTQKILKTLSSGDLTPEFCNNQWLRLKVIMKGSQTKTKRERYKQRHLSLLVVMRQRNLHHWVRTIVWMDSPYVTHWNHIRTVTSIYAFVRVFIRALLHVSICACMYMEYSMTSDG